MRKYSPATGGFYDDHARSVPEDAVEVSDEEYRALFAAQRSGKVIVPGAQGQPPVAVDPPPLSLTTEMLMGAAARVMNTAALGLNYDSLRDVISYEDDVNPTYAADAARFKAWRSAVRTFTLAATPGDYADIDAFVAALPVIGS